MIGLADSGGAEVADFRYDAFGVERVLWGSDFPYVTRECGYAEAATILENCGAGVTPEEKALLMGGNLQRTFPGGWY